MKISKLFLASTTAIAALFVSSCTKKATADQLEVVEKAFKGLCVSETIGGNPVSINTPMDINGEENCALELTLSKSVKASSGERLDVKLEYSYDESFNSVVKQVINKDNEHDLIKFNYGHVKTDESGNVTDQFDVTAFKLKAKATCGPATLEKEFSINLKHNKAIYDEKSIADIYAVHASGNRYAFQEFDETTGKTYIKGNHGQNFNYVSISGKLEYMTPDKNWGLLSDGEHVMELYRLDESTDRDILEVGKYYTCHGEIAQYKGNVQVSFVRYIEEMNDHSAIAANVAYGELAAGINTSSSPEFKHYYQGINNRTGATLTGYTITTETSEFGTISPGSRFTFNVEKAGKAFTIAWDYHVASNDFADGLDLMGKISRLQKGETILIEGTIRYSSDDLNDNGEWQIVPFESSHIQKVV